MRVIQFLIDFNSIKVQLKHDTSCHVFADFRFQFHKGTIKTGNPTIVSGSELNFNSIKVQLKPGSVPRMSSTLRNFNSIKVQLKQ